jgi:hypothetical protein
MERSAAFLIARIKEVFLLIVRFWRMTRRIGLPFDIGASPVRKSILNQNNTIISYWLQTVKRF